jgi:hypothetical protein
MLSGDMTSLNSFFATDGEFVGVETDHVSYRLDDSRVQTFRAFRKSLTAVRLFHNTEILYLISSYNHMKGTSRE